MIGLAFTNHTNIFEIVREMKKPNSKRQKQLIHRCDDFLLSC